MCARGSTFRISNILPEIEIPFTFYRLSSRCYKIREILPESTVDPLRMRGYFCSEDHENQETHGLTTGLAFSFPEANINIWQERVSSSSGGSGLESTEFLTFSKMDT